jgi:hypothetical protein
MLNRTSDDYMWERLNVENRTKGHHVQTPLGMQTTRVFRAHKPGAFSDAVLYKRKNPTRQHHEHNGR